MAEYKVPQDVEAEDKLIGPFTFRQFIYLIIAAGGIMVGYGLSRINIVLILVPAPLVLFFLVLALPLKKDQPMETYLTAIIRFWLKPRRRLWDPEGNPINVEITAPKTIEAPLTKDFNGTEAAARLAYLSQLADTRGWASRGLTSASDNLTFNDTVVAEAQSAPDVLDSGSSVSQNLGSMMNESAAAHHESLVETMQQHQTPIPASVAPITAVPGASGIFDDSASSDAATNSSTPTYDPYPSHIHQNVIQPASITQPPASPPEPPKAQASSLETVSPDIMRLATNKDLSISTIAREAQRLREQEESEEVVVSFR